MTKTPEQLLTPIEVARKLSISRSKFYRIRGRLIANGVKWVIVDRNIKYLESSIDTLIRKAAETEAAIT
jgi:hypothetical protein